MFLLWRMRPCNNVHVLQGDAALARNQLMEERARNETVALQLKDKRNEMKKHEKKWQQSE